MSHHWVTIQVITPNQDRITRMAQLRKERNARGDDTPYRHAPTGIQALKPRKEAACPTPEGPATAETTTKPLGPSQNGPGTASAEPPNNKLLKAQESPPGRSGTGRTPSPQTPNFQHFSGTDSTNT